jgi:hypothetical protein
MSEKRACADTGDPVPMDDPSCRMRCTVHNPEITALRSRAEKAEAGLATLKERADLIREGGWSSVEERAESARLRKAIEDALSGDETLHPLGTHAQRKALRDALEGKP